MENDGETARSPVTPASSLPDSDVGRSAVLIANYLSCFAVGLAVGGVIPLFSLILERRGVSETMIGANTAVGSLGIICIAPFVPWIVGRLGLATSVVLGIVLSAIALAAIAVTESLLAWFLLRPIYAGGLGIHWVVSETWMNSVASNRDRGRIMAIYVTTIAAGMAAGPAILGMTGTDGIVPFVVFGVATLAAALPLAIVARHAPRLRIGAHGTPWLLIKAAPTIFAAVLAVGLYGGACFVFLPIYGLRSGLVETDAVLLLTAFLAGNLLFQIPVGVLADRFNHRALLLACGGVALVAPFAVSSVMGTVVPLVAFMAIWGGAIFALYTIGITMVGERFQSGELAAANAAFIMTFEIANAAGPLAAGLALGLWAPHGIMAFLIVIAAVFVLVTVLRGIKP
jgi:MFS family permease